MEPIANIKDLAKLAGVSVTTASRVLNGHPYVAEDKRQAVHNAMQQLGYSPNRNAVNLSTGRTGMIAVMLPFVSHPYFAGMVEGISTEALEHQYHVVLCQTDYNQEEEQRVVNLLRDRQVDGLIVCSKQSPWDMFEAQVDKGPIIVCEYTESAHVSSISIDYKSVTRSAMDMLIQLGHRDIGCCIGRPDSLNSQRRLEAIHEALAEIGEELRPEWYFEQCYSIEQGTDVLRKLVSLQKRPSAMLVAGDQSAAGMVLEARKMGIRVPGDLSVISFDNTAIAEAMGLSTFNLSSFNNGQLAFNTFMRQITAEQPNVEKHELMLKYVERSTVGPAIVR